MNQSEEYINAYITEVESFGKKNIDPSFTISNNDYEVIAALIAYFTQDKKLSEKYNISLSKGILLNGPVGSGKTSLMRIMARYAPSILKFKILNCREVSMKFTMNGPSEILKCTTPEMFDSTYPGLCFDEFGTESSFGYYGSAVNVMSEILLSRYNLFKNHKIKTHLISNLDIDEIESLYGTRLRSRFREMLNLISFSPDTKDKRV